MDFPPPVGNTARVSCPASTDWITRRCSGRKSGYPKCSLRSWRARPSRSAMDEVMRHGTILPVGLQHPKTAKGGEEMRRVTLIVGMLLLGTTIPALAQDSTAA